MVGKQAININCSINTVEVRTISAIHVFFSAIVYVFTHFNFPSPFFSLHWASLVAQMVNNLPAMQETQVPSLGQEDHLEKEMATHSGILAWRILWTEGPGGLQSMGSHRVGHNWIDLALMKEWRERRKRRRRKEQRKKRGRRRRRRWRRITLIYLTFTEHLN